jgi:hypothetical protein
LNIRKRKQTQVFGKSSPDVPHPGLEPEVMSLKPLTAVEYISGLINPREAFPFVIRTSFNRENIPATV